MMPHLVATATFLATLVRIAADVVRPSLVNFNTSIPFDGRGFQSTVDGRVFITTPPRGKPSQYWVAQVFRPESITYDKVTGAPDMKDAFSEGVPFRARKKSNGFGLCATDASRPYTMTREGKALYRHFLIDPQPSSGSGVFGRRMGRMEVELIVSRPFTKRAEIDSFRVNHEATTLTTVAGGYLVGIEPTMTADGRLMVWKSAEPRALMYSYNDEPCAVEGWSEPQPLNWMHRDSNPGLAKYPISWRQLRAANGTKYGGTSPLSEPLFSASYPWLDHEGRNVVYLAYGHELVGLIGADTKWTAYNIDGAINGDRFDRDHSFYSSPMWKFERERAPAMTFPPGQSNNAHFLPVTKSHDVLPLFGSMTRDYNEIDVGELRDPFHIISLPMNEMVLYNEKGGTYYDLRRTPDISGHFYTGHLLGNVKISESLSLTQANGNSLWLPHGKGKAMVFSGGGAVGLLLDDPRGEVPGIGRHLTSISVQFALRPDENINEDCGSASPSRYVVTKDPQLSISYESSNQLQFTMEVNGKLVSLGKSPAITPGEWSHVAWTWDGMTGSFNEYINGVSTARTLPVVPGKVLLGEGHLFLGADKNLDGGRCPTNGSGSFVGAMDEFTIYSHARSARSICASALGVDCNKEAIKENPTRPFELSAEAPYCTGPDKLDTIACHSAIHRGCAERGVGDVLSSRANLQGTIIQLISDRPPIPLAGVPVASTSEFVTVGCIPIHHQSLAVEFEWLARFQQSCSHEQALMNIECTLAISQFCKSLGWSTGKVFELTSRPWVSCFNSELQEDVELLPFWNNDQEGPNFSPSVNVKASMWCRERGYGAGLIQGGGHNTFDVQCFRPSATVEWPFTGAHNDTKPMGKNVEEVTTWSDTRPMENNNTVGSVTWSGWILGECQGGCNNDDDCQGNLICYIQNGSDKVPGCNIDPRPGYKYCISSLDQTP